jgi:hypothetical protein
MGQQSLARQDLNPYGLNFARSPIFGKKAALRGPKGSLEPVRDGETVPKPCPPGAGPFAWDESSGTRRGARGWRQETAHAATRIDGATPSGVTLQWYH